MTLSQFLLFTTVGNPVDGSGNSTKNSLTFLIEADVPSPLGLELAGVFWGL